MARYENEAPRLIAGMERWFFTDDEVIGKMMTGIPRSQSASPLRFCVDNSTTPPGLIVFRELPVEKP